MTELTNNDLLKIIALNAVSGGGVLSGTVPVGYYVRLRTQQVTGSPSFSYITGQETAI